MYYCYIRYLHSDFACAYEPHKVIRDMILDLPSDFCGGLLILLIGEHVV